MSRPWISCGGPSRLTEGTVALGFRSIIQQSCRGDGQSKGLPSNRIADVIEFPSLPRMLVRFLEFRIPHERDGDDASVLKFDAKFGTRDTNTPHTRIDSRRSR